MEAQETTALLLPGAEVEEKNPEETAGPIGFATFGWLDGLIKTCYAKENPPKDAVTGEKA